MGGAWQALGQTAASLKNQNANPQAAAGSGTSIAEPRACFSESLRVFQQMNAEGEQARTLRAWAEVELQAGKTEESRKMAEEARGIFLRLGMAFEVEETDALLRSVLP